MGWKGAGWQENDPEIGWSWDFSMVPAIPSILSGYHSKKFAKVNCEGCGAEHLDFLGQTIATTAW